MYFTTSSMVASWIIRAATHCPLRSTMIRPAAVNTSCKRWLIRITETPRARNWAMRSRTLPTSLTARLAVKEVGKVLDLIAQLRARGVSVILISHRLQDVFTAAGRIMVLRSGQCVAERMIHDATMDEVVKYIVGAEAGA